MEENQFFSNNAAGVPPQLHFESPWQPLSSSPMNCSSQHPQDFFYTPPTWEKKSTDHHGGSQFDSAISSMVSSPAASNSNIISNDNFVLRELIGKLGNIGGSSSDEISISPHVITSSYNNTPLSSPPKSVALNSTVAQFSADPGFAERAAKFSCFGSRSFNGRTRTTQLGLNNVELSQRSNLLIESGGKLNRVSSSPSLKALGIGSQLCTQQENNNSPQLQDQMEVTNSHEEESTISEQTLNGDKDKPSNYVNSRKRKASSKGKAKETSNSTNPPMAGEAVEHSYAKRSKSNENGQVKAEEESKGGATSNNGGEDKQNKSNSKPPTEPPKDYIHVRARRGQATDSHSLAERVRREKISERMKLLQDLVPGCNKVTGKALMLDEIINYVQSLQRQVEFLSMKLATVNTRLDFSVESVISKDIFQSNNSLAQPIFPLDFSAQAFYGQQPQQNHNNIPNGTVTHSSVDPLDTSLCQNLGMQLPHLNGFNEASSQYPLTFSEDDLHAIVQMGFGQTTNKKTPIQFQNFNGSNQVPL